MNKRVYVTGVAADSPGLTEMTEGLRARGTEAVTAFPESDAPDILAVVIGLSPSALADATFIGRLENVRGARLVPVRLDAVDGDDVPGFLGELNWILWDEQNTATACAGLLTAVHSDVGRYRDARSLEAYAAAWNGGGRNAGMLMSDRDAIRRAQEGYADRRGAEDTLTAPSAVLLQFLAASRRHARRERRRRNGRWVFRAAMIAVIALVVYTGFVTVRNLRAANLLAFPLSMPTQASVGSASITAMKFAGLVGQQRSSGHAVPSTAGEAIVELMAKPWGRGILGADRSAALNGFALVDDPDEAITVDGNGMIAFWDLSDGSARVQRGSDVPLYDIAATPDGTVLATTDAEQVLRVTDTTSGEVVRAAIPDNAEELVISDDGAHVAVVVGGELVIGSVGPAGLSLRTGSEDAPVLDAVAGRDGRIRVLRSHDGDLVVRDAMSDAVHAVIPAPPGDVTTGAISPDGNTVVIDAADGTLWRSRGGDPAMPTGRPVTGQANALAVLDSGVIVYSTPANGVQVFDPAAQSTLPACAGQAMSVLAAITVSPDGTQIVCSAGGSGLVESLADMHSSGAPPFPVLGSAAGRSAAAGGTTVEILDADTVRIATGIGEVRIRRGDWSNGLARAIFVESEPTVVAVRPDGGTVAVGNDRGKVVEIDVDDGYVRMAGLWRRSDAPVSQVGWNEDATAIAVALADGRWWEGPSCAGCAKDLDTLNRRIADRRWFCYIQPTLDLFLDETRAAFDLHRCPALPEAPK